MASTSAFEIGFAAAAVGVPADAAEVPAAGAVDGEGAELPFADPAEGAEEPAAAVTLAACLEPKMADTILPKTLILSSCLLLVRPATRHPERRLCPCEGPVQVKEHLAVLWRVDSVEFYLNVI